MDIDRGPALLAIARGAIAEAFGQTASALESASWLQEPGATFVTIKLDGELRGCIGTLSAKKPLAEDAAFNAKAAAFQDSRFPALSHTEFLHSMLEVSLLSPMERIVFKDKTQLLTLLRPGVDGVVLEYRGWRSTFLPQVWEQLPDPETFLAHLIEKAGLPTGFWADDIKCSRYTVTKWQEKKVLEGQK